MFFLWQPERKVIVMAGLCHFCKSAAEAPPLDRGFTACRKCAREKLLPWLRQCLGAEDLVGALNEATVGGPGKGAMMSLAGLTAAAKKIRASAVREGRELRGAELSLSLLETQERQRALTTAAARRQRQPRRLVGAAGVKEAAKKMVTKLGLSVPAPK
jgi:hypothetical protein